MEVEENDRGFMVVVIVDGERRLIEPPHIDREAAELAAKSIDHASDRFTGAAEEVPPEPDKYPGDGE